MTTDNERAILLAETTARHLAAARQSLIDAANTTEKIDRSLLRDGERLSHLAAQADLIVIASEPRGYTQRAHEEAEEVDQRLRDSLGALGDVRSYLEGSAGALNDGLQALAELEQMPGRQGGATQDLRTRLVDLGTAVRSAERGINEASDRLGPAQSKFEQARRSVQLGSPPPRTAAVFREASAEADRAVTSVRQLVGGASGQLNTARPNATAAATESAELADATRAGLNPTPSSESGQAALLAETVARTLAAARLSLTNAANTTEEIERSVRGGEQELLELAARADLVRRGTPLRGYAQRAQAEADNANLRFSRDLRGLGDVGYYLGRSAGALNAAWQALAALEQMPGGQSETTQILRARLDVLGTATRAAGIGVEEASARLTSAQNRLEPALESSVINLEPDRTVGVFHDASVGADMAVTPARQWLRGTLGAFTTAEPEAAAAARESADLLIAARAGLNPTNTADRDSSAGSSEIDRWPRPPDSRTSKPHREL